jgi:hypothetical protein
MFVIPSVWPWDDDPPRLLSVLHMEKSSIDTVYHGVLLCLELPSVLRMDRRFTSVRAVIIVIVCVVLTPPSTTTNDIEQQQWTIVLSISSSFVFSRVFCGKLLPSRLCPVS